MLANEKDSGTSRRSTPSVVVLSARLACSAESGQNKQESGGRGRRSTLPGLLGRFGGERLVGESLLGGGLGEMGGLARCTTYDGKVAPACRRLGPCLVAYCYLLLQALCPAGPARTTGAFSWWGWRIGRPLSGFTFHYCISYISDSMGSGWRFADPTRSLTKCINSNPSQSHFGCGWL